jgi:hypothetical protein
MACFRTRLSSTVGHYQMEFDPRQNEVAFCANVKSWSDSLFQRDQTLPFDSAAIEQYGRGTQKRQDLRIYARAGASLIRWSRRLLPNVSACDATLEHREGQFVLRFRPDHFVNMLATKWI